MILRKPYAFFIKHFKLFNIILTILEVYMIYKLSFLVQFLFEYSGYPQGAVGRDLVGSLLKLRVFIVGIVIALFALLLILVLSFKKKPIKLYLFTIIFNITLVITLFIIRNYLEIMQMQVIETRTAFVIRDFALMGMIGSIIIAFLSSMRSLGFDIKSFEFGQDLHDLNISEEDNEEFELQLDIDSQGLKRNLNKNARYFKYFIKENKLFIVIFITAIIGIGSYFIYANSGIYFNTTKVEQVVKVNNFSIGTNKSYITDKDYKSNIITTKDKTLLVVPIKIKTNTVKEKMNVTRFALNINGHKFYHTTAYKDRLIDLGTTYNDNVINSEFENYILVFEIPKTLVPKNMILEYHSESDQVVKFKVEKINLDNPGETKNYNLNELIKFKDKLIEDGTFIINEYEISNKIKLYYNLCITTDECYTSYEYLVPDYKSNYDKTILKITGKLNLDKTQLKAKNLYEFINNYGTIIYSINGEVKTHNIDTPRILPQKATPNQTYYIEVLDEVKDAEHISIQFKLRNNTYTYNLK